MQKEVLKQRTVPADLTAINDAVVALTSDLDIDLIRTLGKIDRTGRFEGNLLGSVQLTTVLSQARIYTKIVEQVGRVETDFATKATDQRACFRAVSLAVKQLKGSHREEVTLAFTQMLVGLMGTMFAVAERAIVEADHLFGALATAS